MDRSTPTKVKEYYIGREDGLRTYLLIMVTAVINKMFEMDETREAPTCIRLEYRMVLESDEQAVSISASV